MKHYIIILWLWRNSLRLRFHIEFVLLLGSFQFAGIASFLNPIIHFTYQGVISLTSLGEQNLLTFVLLFHSNLL